MTTSDKIFYYEIEYTNPNDELKQVIISSSFRKARAVKILKEIHADWDIKKMKKVSRPDWITPLN